MRIAITGSSGYLGSVISSEIPRILKLGRGDEVELFFDLESDSELTLPTDLDILIHVAWSGRSKSGGSVNLSGTRRLIQAAIKAGIRRIIFISSLAAFPDCPSNHGREKLLVEQMVLEACGTVLRPGMVVGRDARGLFGKIVRLVKFLKTTPRISPEDNLYFVTAEDLLAVIKQLISNGAANSGKIFSVTYPEPLSLAEVLSSLIPHQGEIVVSSRFLRCLLRIIKKVIPGAARAEDSLNSLLRQPGRELIMSTLYPFSYANPARYLRQQSKL